MSSIFVVYALDLIAKVCFVYIGLVLEVHGLFCWFSWTFLVFPLYSYPYIYHLPKRHMMSGHVWTLSAFVSIIVHTDGALPAFPGLCRFAGLHAMSNVAPGLMTNGSGREKVRCRTFSDTGPIMDTKLGRTLDTRAKNFEIYECQVQSSGKKRRTSVCKWSV